MANTVLPAKCISSKKNIYSKELYFQKNNKKGKRGTSAKTLFQLLYTMQIAGDIPYSSCSIVQPEAGNPFLYQYHDISAMKTKH